MYVSEDNREVLKITSLQNSKRNVSSRAFGKQSTVRQHTDLFLKFILVWRSWSSIIQRNF